MYNTGYNTHCTCRVNSCLHVLYVPHIGYYNYMFMYKLSRCQKQGNIRIVSMSMYMYIYTLSQMYMYIHSYMFKTCYGKGFEYTFP